MSTQMAELLSLACKGPRLLLPTDGPYSYTCPECGQTCNDLTDAELREFEQQGHCGLYDDKGVKCCPECHGEREVYVRDYWSEDGLRSASCPVCCDDEPYCGDYD